jgi:sugar lactone lactonase YvrE
MVVAPYNPGQGYTDETTHYLVYVCDTASNRVWRFDPTAATPQSTLEKIFDNGAGLAGPQCGRITSTGDLVVSSTVAGSGLWVFSGVTNLALGSGPQTPTQLVGVGGSSEGIAQKNIGDLLVVDKTNNKVLRTPPSAPASTTTFISSGLSQPFGIARRGDGDIFVSNQGGKTNVLHFNAQGASPTTCTTFKNNTVPNFMQMALDNTLYVAVATNNAGSVRSVNANTCQVTQNYSVPYPAVGIALPPTMTASQTVTASNGTALVNFGYSAFELNQIAGACGGSISVGLASPAAITTLITNSGAPATPAVNLGLDGFEAIYNTANLNGCEAGATNNFQMSNLLSAGVTNPKIVVCTDPNPNTTTNCQPQNTSLTQLAAWPIGGYLPNDMTGGGSKSLRCRIFMANAQPVNGAPGQEAGTFCGFQSPVNNTSTGVLNGWNLALASSFSPGKSIPVKFKLGTGIATGACQSAPYITDATAILSVAQILDAKGNPVFVTIGLVSNGSSGLGQPLFKGDGNQQYLFNWDSSSCIMPSGVTQVCPKGTYSMSVLLLTNNTPGGAQSIYGAQTTIVTLK